MKKVARLLNLIGAAATNQFGREAFKDMRPIKEKREAAAAGPGSRRGAQIGAIYQIVSKFGLRRKIPPLAAGSGGGEEGLPMGANSREPNVITHKRTSFVLSYTRSVALFTGYSDSGR